jgi:hypothetical protein
MSSITISNLQPAGLNLFSDAEGYLNDLSETEQNIQGGIWWVYATMATVGAFGVGVATVALYKSGPRCGLD